MTARILIVGQDADTVDYAAPGIMPGMTAEKVRAGLAASKAALEAQGHACDVLEVQPDPATAEAEVRAGWPARPTTWWWSARASAIRRPSSSCSRRY
ncbi:hypothetical protein [Caulobacter segnis]|uniref:hypothetical protein n=1 Tax=Caulobacter segnis TaxID=88688 RepID=UPI001CC17364|nr:hypothetical protein [Caulobacter segnis]